MSDYYHEDGKVGLIVEITEDTISDLSRRVYNLEQNLREKVESMSMTDCSRLYDVETDPELWCAICGGWGWSGDLIQCPECGGTGRAPTQLPRAEASSSAANVANDHEEPQRGENEWVTYVE